MPRLGLEGEKKIEAIIKSCSEGMGIVRE